MRKITLFAVVAAVIATGVVGIWATSPTNARVASLGQGINPHHIMMNARALPATEFADYTHRNTLMDVLRGRGLANRNQLAHRRVVFGLGAPPPSR